jgi:cell wall-associated NlpC family hydrolase
VALVAVGSLTLGLLAGPATADPAFPSAREVERSRSVVASTAASVGQIEGRLAAASARSAQLATEVAQAVEAYNGARFRLEQAQQAAFVAQQKAGEAQREVDAARRELGRFAAAAYREGGDLGGLSAFLSSNGPQDLIDRASAIDSIGDSRRRALARLRSAEVAAAVLQQRARHLVASRAAAATAVEAAKVAAQGKLAAQRQAVAAMASERQALIVALAKARSTSVRLERARQAGLERARAERAEQARRAQQRRAALQRRAAAAARDRDQSSGGSTSGGSNNGSGRSPSGGSGGSSAGTLSGASAAIAFARAQIGKPYEWAATGPDTFDCSGLTMRAWEHGGVSLPHYSVAQYEQGRKVAISELRRGDLVFFGSDPGNPGSIYHVGLYIGGGQMIEAPYTGEDVRVSSIYRDSLFGAARP